MEQSPSWRKTTQTLLPSHHIPSPGQYDLYPSFPLGPEQVQIGYSALANQIQHHKRIILEGYGGVFWEHFRAHLDQALTALGLQVAWHNIEQAYHSETAIDSLVGPFLGGDDPLFGKRFTGSLATFFDPNQLRQIQPDPSADINIVYGPGAALAGWEGLLVYIDVPKNEIQFRSRAATICNLGVSQPDSPKAMYKRFYFVDWVVLNKHKSQLLQHIDLFVDAQRPDEPTFASGTAIRDGLTTMSRNTFRVRPWFEPGPWGGQWIKKLIPQLPQDVPNYAWSFELIVPENGLLFESDNCLLEISFDFLMYHANEAVLGAFASRFQYEFPIRFDFLDTIDGGSLSLQCHPRPTYIRDQFGESFTQDETYYILDCKPSAQVYLGFQEGVDPDEFRAELERSFLEGVEIDVGRFVNSETAHKHDLFLIPSGTVHCSGEGSLVLEISATPYIFTFKMYDWLRLDLEGKLRPLNIERAFQNLDFGRQGTRVQSELVSRPQLLEEGPDWRLMHLPTHPDHFYDIHRFEFYTSVGAATNGSPHVMSLVEGNSILLETSGGIRQRFSFGETFVVPAAAEHYRLINDGETQAMVVKAFLKPSASYESSHHP